MGSSVLTKYMKTRKMKCGHFLGQFDMDMYSYSGAIIEETCSFKICLGNTGKAMMKCRLYWFSSKHRTALLV